MAPLLVNKKNALSILALICSGCSIVSGHMPPVMVASYQHADTTNSHEYYNDASGTAVIDGTHGFVAGSMAAWDVANPIAEPEAPPPQEKTIDFSFFGYVDIYHVDISVPLKPEWGVVPPQSVKLYADHADGQGFQLVEEMTNFPMSSASGFETFSFTDSITSQIAPNVARMRIGVTCSEPTAENYPAMTAETVFKCGLTEVEFKTDDLNEKLAQIEVDQENMRAGIVMAISSLNERIDYQHCYAGTLEEVLAACGTECCVGDGTDDACRDWAGVNTVCPGACQGAGACAHFNQNVIVRDGSCVGTEACSRIGEHAEFDADITIGSGSCIGLKACMLIGDIELLGLNIGDQACIGDRACYDIRVAATSPSGIYFHSRGHNVEIDTNACSGPDFCNSCHALATDHVEVDVVTLTFKTGAASCAQMEAQTHNPLDGHCHTGTLEEVLAECGDTCCVGDGTAAACGDWDGINTICPGACIGNSSCFNLRENTVVRDNSCVGLSACEYLGEGTSIWEDSCIGEYSCNSLGEFSSFAEVRSGSCVGLDVCWSLDASEVVSVGSGSCIGDLACDYVGGKGIIEIVIGDNSCVNDFSCQGIEVFPEDVELDWRHHFVIIEDDACSSGDEPCRMCDVLGTDFLTSDIVILTVQTGATSCDSLEVVTETQVIV